MAEDILLVGSRFEPDESDVEKAKRALMKCSRSLYLSVSRYESAIVTHEGGPGTDYDTACGEYERRYGRSASPCYAKMTGSGGTMFLVFPRSELSPLISVGGFGYPGFEFTD